MENKSYIAMAIMRACVPSDSLNLEAEIAGVSSIVGKNLFISSITASSELYLLGVVLLSIKRPRMNFGRKQASIMQYMTKLFLEA